MSENRRLFFAVVPEGLVGSAPLADVFKKIKVGADRHEIEVKWVNNKNLHVTTNFIGAAPEDHLEPLLALGEAAAAQQPAFTLKLRQVGAFPEITAARVIWVGVARNQALVALMSRLAAGLQDLGYPPDEREFVPHLSVGRLRNPKSIKDLLSPVVRREIGEFSVTRLVLFASEVFGQQVVYTPIKEFPLAPAP